MKICAAQVKSIAGEINQNMVIHRRCIEQAAKEGANLIVFPELSLTGYEPRLAKDLATTQEDGHIDELQLISNRNSIVICAGIPTTSAAGICISMVILQPNAHRQTYSKQQLHDDELPYFVPGHDQVIITIGDHKITPAICYESLQPGHAVDAAAMGATIYIASVAKSEKGIEKAYKHYPEIAKQHNMTVVMANCIGFCDDFESAGQSAAWGSDGTLLGQLDGVSEGLLMIDLGAR